MKISNLVQRKSNLSNKSYKYTYFRSFIPKDLLTHFDGITKFRFSLNCVRKEDKQILCLNLKQITDKLFTEIRNLTHFVNGPQ